MAKLTPEQKEANKVATKERDKAYRARRKAYSAEIEAAEKAAEASPEHSEWEQANNNLKQAIEARNQAVSEIDKKIEELQRLRDSVQAEHNEKIEVIQDARRIAFGAQNELKSKLKSAVSEKYADVANCYSAAGWKRPEGV